MRATARSRAGGARRAGEAGERAEVVAQRVAQAVLDRVEAELKVDA
jgi:RNA 3'-terminal phosphate cyclase